MKKYKTLLFDIDDTVLDFKATELYALESLFKKLELDFNDESVKKYQEVNHIFNNLTQSERESTLMIGDSLTADILGGNQAGIDTCWYNLNNIENTTGIIPTYEIRNLSELYNIL